MPLRGWPSNLSRNNADHDTVKPQLLGCSGSITMPSSDRVAAQRPSDPSCGQLAPPSARTVASERNASRPSGVSKPSEPSGSQPVQRCRGRNFTPRRVEPLQPGAQQRGRLERRREDPPARADERLLAETLAPDAQIRWREPQDGTAQQCGRIAVTGHEAMDVFAMRQVQAAAAGQQELAPGRGHAVVERHPGTAAAQHLGGHGARQVLRRSRRQRGFRSTRSG